MIVVVRGAAIGWRELANRSVEWAVGKQATMKLRAMATAGPRRAVRLAVVTVLPALALAAVAPARAGMAPTAAADQPRRLELDGVFNSFSYRTLQRSLKGRRLDVRPLGGVQGRHQPLLFLTGASETDGHDFAAETDLYNGASWLIEDIKIGRYAVNIIQNTRDVNAATSGPGRLQRVFSVAGENALGLFGDQQILEGEVSWFHGDYGDGAAMSRDQSDSGFTLSLNRRRQGRPLNYSLRYEYYGNDYQPAGGGKTPNRRAAEFRGGWQFDNRLELSGRLQRLTDGVEGAAKVDTDTLGLTLGGPLPLDYLPGLNGRLDTFVQGREDKAGTANRFTRSATLNFGLPLPGRWALRAAGLLRSVDNRNTDSNVNTRQADLGVSHGLALGKFRGTISSGLRLRGVSGGGASNDVGPRLQLRLARDNHVLAADYKLLYRHRRAAAGGDSASQDLTLSYDHGPGPYAFGLKADLQRRDIHSGRDTDAAKLSIFWRMSFDGAARGAVQDGPIGRLVEVPLFAGRNPWSLEEFR